MNKNEVDTAFEILLEEIEEVFNMIGKEGEEAFKFQKFDKARSLIEYGERLKSFREKVKTLQKEWQTVFSDSIPTQVSKRKIKGKLKKRLRTPENEFFISILESLIELGGSAKVENVLRLVYDKMKAILNEYDYETLSSGEIRWKNTAQWARYTMVNEGLLACNSPWGDLGDNRKRQKILRRK